VASSENGKSFFAMLGDFTKRNDFLIDNSTALGSPIIRQSKVYSCNSLDYQIILSQSSCFIKAADIHLSCVWDPEWLSAED
jgi:hypothetical protein